MPGAPKKKPYEFPKTIALTASVSATVWLLDTSATGSPSTIGAVIEGSSLPLRGRWHGKAVTDEGKHRNPYSMT